CSIPLLPFKPAWQSKRLIDPLRAVAFKGLNNGRRRHCRRQGKKRMDMVCGAANLNRLHLLSASNASEVAPYPLAEVSPQRWLPILCAENKVNVERCICLCHGDVF